MATLKSRLEALERASTDADEEGYLDVLPLMEESEWLEAARLQQAALLKELYENA